MTARELASRQANLKKAHAASRGNFRPSEKRLRASLANLAKAQAARRTPEGNARARLNALKHGLFAGETLLESVDRLGEDKAEFERHLELFERVFVPADEEERLIVRALGETVWRRLRFFHAHAVWEKDRLYRVFDQAGAVARLNLDLTVARANGLALVLMDFDDFYRELNKLESKIEFSLRKLIRKRSGGKLRWRMFSPRRDPEMEESREEEQMDRFAEYWQSLSPEEQAAVRDQVRREVEAKMMEVEKEG